MNETKYLMITQVLLKLINFSNIKSKMKTIQIFQSVNNYNDKMLESSWSSDTKQVSRPVKRGRTI